MSNTAVVGEAVVGEAVLGEGGTLIQGKATGSLLLAGKAKGSIAEASLPSAKLPAQLKVAPRILAVKGLPAPCALTGLNGVLTLNATQKLTLKSLN